jgi:hypothetical protein
VQFKKGVLIEIAVPSALVGPAAHRIWLRHRRVTLKKNDTHTHQGRRRKKKLVGFWTKSRKEKDAVMMSMLESKMTGRQWQDTEVHQLQSITKSIEQCRGQ